MALLRAREAPKGAPFLTAEWRHLAILNYEAAPSLLTRRVPPGTELDLFHGHALLSVVGFVFLETSVLGVQVPFHTRFEEVNLRFYVRRKVESAWRRSVVFVREIVPRRAVALTARLLFHENYVALPMDHEIRSFSGPEGRLASVVYGWRFRGRRSSLTLSADEPTGLPAPGSEEEFVVEHYFGCSVGRDGFTREYAVEHPPWRTSPACEAFLDCDVRGIYGEEFVESLPGRPRSALLAEGSGVRVYRGRRLRG